MNTNQHKFSEVPKIHIPRSLFSRPHNLKTAIDVDLLYPIYVDEALPASTWKFSGQFFGRLATPLVPIMDNLYLDTFFFAVPIRLLDEDFAKVMGERRYAEWMPQEDYTVPMLKTGANGVAVGSLYDYLGIPPRVPNLEFSAYYPRAYALIYNEWFRSGQLDPPIPVGTKNGRGETITETIGEYSLHKRCKSHDYFTSCLPTPQRGDVASLGFSGSLPIYADHNFNPLSFAWAENSNIVETKITTGQASSPSAAHSPFLRFNTEPTVAHNDLGLLPDSHVHAHAMASGISVTVDKLREAFALQRLLEIDNRSGYARLIEIIKGHFGVDSPDLRAQRPEYLGGFSQPLSVTSVPQTSQTTETSPQANLSAFVTASANAHWIKSFTEHCIIIGLANIRADLGYQQGLHRMFSRKTRYDFYWPALANLGEQAVLNKEIFAQGDQVLDSSGNVVDNQPFGYQERWAEYRYHPNMITGVLRSVANNGLDCWHLAEYYANLPKLGDIWIKQATPLDRAIAVPSEPAMILDCYFDVQCALPMPLYSVPSIGSSL